MAGFKLSFYQGWAQGNRSERSVLFHSFFEFLVTYCLNEN